ncbi:hypothetical protein PHYBLDRAFT_164735 [Phycomyces blakesleeanus NRRL 1555(-)]|uniref:Uncharacterized protein n=1 Tax=Phycomyces blakesleeanus (strain ATCC 8743b / DSM 1359 / FGSC 10004 / NBRC 33097 / NRRL 1555) TaxID=763407 RepID=A0A162Y1E1_PHYB8|nr:hypothetical protein PHYBLDRAFT_164735 [Phycomyces blakesleeanus NRRL 1555(-)]OAD77845.1 hypothetical protein PHYBLDRAFT_164735 [Phycomyces blakesleeanus NRRL 1555(-)]|eukprot:XP_018295885.1 hypothetical protein PHYBLDRAFT_164735 [Phycomyces blakesleeanus NRRL 1555(-)]
MVTLLILLSAPENVYKCLEYILNQYEGKHELNYAFDIRRLPIPRLFSILLNHLMHWRSVVYSVNSLSAFVKNPLPKGYDNDLQLFYEVFNFKLLEYSSIEGLMFNGENNVLLGIIDRSDGFSVDFLFYKRSHNTTDEISIVDHDFGIKHFIFEEVTKMYRPSFLDPGRNRVFTAAVRLDPNDHQLRRCTTKEYFHLTGSTVMDTVFTFYGFNTVPWLADILEPKFYVNKVEYVLEQKSKQTNAVTATVSAISWPNSLTLLYRRQKFKSRVAHLYCVLFVQVIRENIPSFLGSSFYVYGLPTMIRKFYKKTWGVYRDLKLPRYL